MDIERWDHVQGIKMDDEIFFKGVNSISSDGTWNHDQGSEFKF